MGVTKIVLYIAASTFMLVPQIASRAGLVYPHLSEPVGEGLKQQLSLHVFPLSMASSLLKYL